MERVSPQKDWLRVDDPVAAALVVDDASRRYLEPLITQALTASQLALFLSVHHSSVLYRMRQFVARGLVAVERVERRAGRPMTYYRAAAAGYFVPFAATQFESQDTIASGAFRRLQRVLERSIAAAWTQAAGDATAGHSACTCTPARTGSRSTLHLRTLAGTLEPSSRASSTSRHPPSGTHCPASP